MATYTKETALYDTGAIANDIGEAGETASKYITAVDQNGIKVHAENNINANYSLINADGMEIFQGDTAADSVSVAKFGVITRIGTDTSANISIDEDSITGVGEDGKSFFKFADSDTPMTSILTMQLYSGMGQRFPSTAGSGLRGTLPATPDSGSTIEVIFKLKNSNVSASEYSISFTQGAADSKSLNATYRGSSYTLYAKYNGDLTLYSIWASPQMTNIDNVTCRIRYQTSSIAPSFEIGEDVSATGGYSYAEGNGTTASGNYSHAEGKGATASGNISHAEGNGTTASGSRSHAEGSGTQAIGDYCHAEGSNTTAGADNNGTKINYAHAEGYMTQATGEASHAEGKRTYATGEASHAEGYNTTASGIYSHTEGYMTEASYECAHAEGYKTKATKNYSHAEGYNTTASGLYSHAEGFHSTASYAYSHAEGCYTTTSGLYSHAEGYYSTASGLYSHAGGMYVTANGSSQTAIGQYNVADTTSLFIIGNGSSTDARSNALTVGRNGNADIAGDVSAGGDIIVTGNASIGGDVDIASGASYKINGTSLIDIFYPIGSYYETSDTTFDPNTAWGGTWSLETEGLVHIGAGSTYTVGDTGGNKDAVVPYHNHTLTNPTVTTPTLTVDNSHAGEYVGSASAISSLNRQLGSVGSSGGDYNYLRVAHTGVSLTRSSPSISAGKTCTVTGGSIGYAGTNGNTADANMQPYIVVNRWHRTA